MTNLAKVKKLTLENIDTDKTLQLDVSAHPQGGTITTIVIPGEPVPNLDEDVSKLGISGYVTATGKSASRSAIGDIVTLELGKRELKKSISYGLTEDNTEFKCHKLVDLVDKLEANLPPTIKIKYTGYDLLTESYTFAGKVIDALNDLAGLVYGKVNYEPTTEVYYVTSGDRAYVPPNSASFTIKSENIVSYKVITQRDTSIKDLGTELLNIIKQICKLKAAIVDAADTEAKVKTPPKILANKIEFDFGTKEGFKKIDTALLVESTEWDTWEHEPNKDVYPPGQTEKSYFKVETLKDYDPSSGVNKVVKRGLRTIVGASIYHRLLNVDVASVRDVVGKGYTTGLWTNGLPTKSRWEKDKQDSIAATKVSYDDEYHKLYDIEIREEKIKVVNGGLTSYETICVPYLKFTLETQLAGALNNDREKLLEQQYGARIDIMVKSTSTPLKYKGALDKHGRLISETGQVQLIQAVVDKAPPVGESGPNPGTYFYAPVNGMDMSFITKETMASNPATPATPVGNAIDEAKLKASLLKAYDELKEIATKGATPIAQYDEDPPKGYPRFLRGYVENPYVGPGQPPMQGPVIGVEYETVSIFNSDREAKTTLTVSETVNADRRMKALQRKLKAFESKLALMKKVIAYETKVTIDIEALIKKTSTYLVLVEKVKDESIQVMQQAKADYDEAVDIIFKSLNYDSKAVKEVATVTILAENSMPEIGSTFKLPSNLCNFSFITTNVTSSGVTFTLAGEYDHIEA